MHQHSVCNTATVLRNTTQHFQLSLSCHTSIFNKLQPREQPSTEHHKHKVVIISLIIKSAWIHVNSQSPFKQTYIFQMKHKTTFICHESSKALFVINSHWSVCNISLSVSSTRKTEFLLFSDFSHLTFPLSPHFSYFCLTCSFPPSLLVLLFFTASLFLSPDFVCVFVVKGFVGGWGCT